MRMTEIALVIESRIKVSNKRKHKYKFCTLTQSSKIDKKSLALIIIIQTSRLMLVPNYLPEYHNSIRKLKQYRTCKNIPIHSIKYELQKKILKVLYSYITFFVINYT